MTNSPLPDPGLGRNPPRYRRLPTSPRTRAWIAGVVVGAFVVAGGTYYVFSVNQIPTAANTGSTTTAGQGTDKSR